MNKDLIISTREEGTAIALLENKKLVELRQDKKNQGFTFGDIYLGKVKKLIPGLNAAFVNIGHSKDAFLHYTDLGSKILSLIKYTDNVLAGNQKAYLLNDFSFEKETTKTGKIADVLKPNQTILVQINKEAISTKGPKLSCEITIAGRYLVLSPFNEVVSISKQIKNSDERKRLEKLVASIKPKNFGLIVRTAAEGKNVSDINDCLQGLLLKWQHCFEILKAIGLQKEKALIPKVVLVEETKTTTILRDILNTSFNNIIIDKKEIYEETKGYINKIAPEQGNIVQFYNSDIPIFDHYNISKQIKSSFGEFVSLPISAYLVIERTEALHVIDVNSGKKVDKDSNIEENALRVNLDASKEIARQIRLRDMGGIIVIDFIDLRNPVNKKQVYNTMKDLMKSDRAKHNILPLSKFSLMQITRQRVRPEVQIDTSESCPSCNGAGEIQSTLLIIENIEKNLKNLIEQKKKPLKLYVHPFIEAYLKKGYYSIKRKWFVKYGKLIKIMPNESFQLMEYYFYNAQGIVEQRTVST